MVENLAQPPQTWPDSAEVLWLRDALDGIFAIADITSAATNDATVRIRGRFLVDSASAYRRLAPACRARGRTLLFRWQGGEPVILVHRRVIRPTPNNRWLPALLAAATVVSVLFSYVFGWGDVELTFPAILRALPKGWAFAGSILAFLLAHELGHLFTARHLGVAATLPYLIPFPLSPFGTMGAVIRLKDVPSSKKALLLIGAAGPLAGLLVAIPVLLTGLAMSQVAPLPTEGAYSMEGNSLLYLGLKWVSFGKLLPAKGLDVMLHPVAFAGWAGILITSLNLIPAGQLDGGHVAYALLGDKARFLTWGVLGVAALLSIWWQGWLLWVVLGLIMSRNTMRPLDDITPLRGAEIGVAVLLLALFVLTFTPIPMRIVVLGAGV